MTESLPHRTRASHLRTVALGLVVLLAGAALGAGGALLWLRNRTLRLVRDPASVPAVIVGRMRAALDLTDAQAARVEAVLRRHQTKLLELRRTIQPRVEGELDQVQREVAAELGPGQAERWNARVEQLRRTWLPPADGGQPAAATPATGP